MTVEETHQRCSLLLEVFALVSIYEDNSDTVEWEVSSDPDHPYPYLLAPRKYAEQEIDPILCTASIGTIEVGVIDAPTDPTDQQTGWMTARVHSMLGRRCRLRRWIDDDTGWMTIADGPAGAPKMDASYAAYRWSIRDTRETERKLTAFVGGGVAAIVPHGPVYGFGEFVDESGGHLLLPEMLTADPIIGGYEVSAVGGRFLGLVNLARHYGSGVDGQTCDDARLAVDEEGNNAIQLSQLSNDLWGSRFADVLWRIHGSGVWNKARPVSPTAFRQPFAGTTEAILPGDTETSITLDYVTLFVSEHIPHGFPKSSGDDIDIIVRYRGPASDEYPYYVEGTLGEVLKNLYDGVYSLAPTEGITGESYDPGELDSPGLDFITRIRYDVEAFDQMLEHVMLRQTESIDDVRAFTESNLYAPSGWIPALDNEMRISPVSRNRPDSVDGELTLTDDVVVPAPNWQTGDRWVSQIEYTYPRYFRPAVDSGFEIATDGLAQRDITIIFEDAESNQRYGPAIETFDCTAFAAVGTNEGANLPGQLEQTSTLAQVAKFELLDRYRAGVQSVSFMVRRDFIPRVRVGDWVPWLLQWLPDRTFGLRGSDVVAAQIVSIRDDDCVWRSIVLEESEKSAGPPGLVISLEKYDDEPSSGGVSLRVVSDVESY